MKTDFLVLSAVAARKLLSAATQLVPFKVGFKQSL